MTLKTAITLTLLSCVLLLGCDTKTKNVEACGDGFVDTGERCDTTVGENSCASLGYYDALGTLTCTSDCQFDVSLCGGRCGDELVQGTDGETCDGGNLNGQTCQSLGYTGGTLACGADCAYDVSGCAGRCGNGVIDEGEICDGAALDDETCETQGFHGGALGCEADCSGYNLDACTAVGRCGDGIIQATYGEVCDGSNLDEETCESQDQHPGTLACDPVTCQFDFAGCGGSCGDGIIQSSHGEACDSSALDGQTCEGMALYAGTLTCGSNCQFDTTGCGGRCGDGTIQTAFGEVCDTDALGGNTCELLGLYAGTISCGSNCQLVTTDCGGSCGDGIIQTAFGEVCDTSALGGATCATEGFYEGTLTCGSNCQLLTSGCSKQCGDGIIQPEHGEICDGTNLDGLTCISLGYQGGTLSCGIGCYYNIGQCTGNITSPNIGTLIYVPAGTFQRDATATNLSTVSAFRMSQYEITRAQWTAVTGWADPSNATYSSGTSDPVQMVKWYDAIAFCNKLSLAEGLTPVYMVSGVDFAALTYAQIPTSNNATWNAATANWAADGYRLPTEMEWMWAAMGADLENPGAVNTTGYAKAFAGSTGSNLIDDYAWYVANSVDKSHPVGTKLPNELGFYDLSGNVWEWVWDWHGTYPTGTVTDYRGPASGSARLERGGYFYIIASSCTVASRNASVPVTQHHGFGFRVVRP